MSASVEKPVGAIASAWMVHLFTASGAVFGLLAMRATSEQRYILALTWMVVTCAIDGSDGALARWRRVNYYLPHFDGALLDNMVDYFTYVIVPAFFLLHVDILPQPWRLPMAVALILASAYQFCRRDAKTVDHTFTGFPSYWNVVVFYLYLLNWPSWVNVLLLTVCALGVFIPVHYLYPSRTPKLRRVNISLGMLWAGILTIALLRYPHGHEILVLVSFFYVAYYFGFSIWLTSRRKLHERDALRSQTGDADLTPETQVNH